MSLTVCGAMRLNALRNFRLVAGQLGLDRRVTRTAILDYEFTGKVPEEIASQFAPGEFVLSSMLYAHEDEAALLEAVQRLVELRVSALAIKTIFFKELPEAVRQLADAERFPIFMFDNSVFFEEVIAEISESAKASDRLNLVESLLDTLMYRDLPLDELRKLSGELNREFRQRVMVFYGRPLDETQVLGVDRIHDAYRRNRFTSPENLVAGYRLGLMVFISSEREDPQHYRARLSDVLVHCGLSQETLVFGCSLVHDALEGLGTALREAVWAQKAAEAQVTGITPFDGIGVYAMLLPHAETPWSDRYWQRFLAPLIQGDAATADLLKTAISYVACAGNLKRTAERLFVHENTVRYRINNLHRLLCPGSDELAFYEQLSLAIRLYVLKKQNRCI